MSKVCYTLTELLKGEKKIAQQWKHLQLIPPPIFGNQTEANTNIHQ